MVKDWIRWLQITVIGAVVFCGASAALTEEETQENAKQQIYLSQMAKYPVLSKEFRDVIEKNAQPQSIPTEDKELFFWQLANYKMLNAGFADVYAHNVETRAVPQTPEEIYLWQLEEYKSLDKEFYDAHRREF